MKPKILSIIMLVALFSGCATRESSTSVFNSNYQTPPLSITQYKSPELRGNNQQNNVSVAVAISGGGHRAGNYGIGVLKELENIQCQGVGFNVLNEIDYLSTVSGGGITAGVYISTLFDHYINNNTTTKYSLSSLINTNQNEITENLNRGYHGILKNGLINIQTLGNLDRGDFLEEEFDNKILGAEQRGKSLVLGDLFIPKSSTNVPITPMWIANGTIYENGGIFPFYPQAIKEYQVTTYTHHLNKIDIAGDYQSLPLAIGLKASASFPGAVPATTFKSTFDSDNPYIHIFDGGLADNIGITNALGMLSDTGINKKILIIIDAYNGQPEPFSNQEGSPLALEIFLKSTVISLDAWRIRYKKALNQLVSSGIYNGKNVNVIYLSFDELSKSQKEKVYKIETNFNISKEQQNDLFEAAKEVVTNQKEKIIDAVFGKNCI